MDGAGGDMADMMGLPETPFRLENHKGVFPKVSGGQKRQRSVSEKK